MRFPKSALLLVPVLLACAGPLVSQNDPAAVRRELLDRINADRARAGVPPLRASEALTRAAQQHADEISRRGTLNESGGEDEMKERLDQAGYAFHEWTENVSASTGGLDDVLRYWRTESPHTWRSLMDEDYRDLGIGLSRLDGMALYTFLFAIPEADHFSRETTGLRDLAAVRREMLAQVNAIRKRHGLRALTADAQLDRAAQGHAEDMLRRAYFAHGSPSGETARERIRATGYTYRTIGENIAFGQTSVEEVVETWMDSPGHRKNILNKDFAELGVGLALGRDSSGRHRTLWVQNFGTPR